MARFFLWIWSRESPARLTRKKRKLCAADSGPCPIPLGSLSLSAFRPHLLRTRALVLKPGGLPIPESRLGPLRLPTPRQRLPTILGKLVTLQINGSSRVRVPEPGPCDPGFPDPQLVLRCPHGSACKPSLVPAPQAGQDAAAAPGLQPPGPSLGLLRLPAARRQLQAVGAKEAPARRAPEAGRKKANLEPARRSQPPPRSAQPGAPGTGAPPARARVPTRVPGAPRAQLPARPLRCLRPAGVRVRSPAPRTRGQCTPRQGPERGEAAGRRGCALAGPGRGRAASFPGLNAARAASLRALPALPQLLCTLPPSLAAPCLPPPCCLPLSPPCCLPLSLSPPCPVAMNNTLAWGLE